MPAWGKLNRDTGARHHLIHHSADVAAVFSVLIDAPIHSARLGASAGAALTANQRTGLTALAFLHDVGKLAPGFQVKADPDRRHPPATDHLTCGWRWACREAAVDGAVALWLGRVPGLLEWLHVLFAHHGRPVPMPSDTVAQQAYASLDGYDWRAEEHQMCEALRAWFDLDSALPPAPTPRLAHHVAGLLALADWVGSDADVFEFEADYRPDYWDTALERARAHVRAIGLDTRDATLSGPAAWPLISDHRTPRPAQSALADIPLDERLVILEAETGAGKTEAALWHFARLYEAGHVGGLYLAVPTRAAARQLKDRVNAAARRMFGRGAPEAVLAIPGQLQAGEASGQRLPGFEVRWDDGGKRPARWAAEHATRFLAARIAVGTVDQATMAGLMVKHAQMRGAAMARSLLVIDEVHASDTYMTDLQVRTVQDHLALGGHALLMSATLGAKARATWLGTALPATDTAADLPYPAVWTCSGVTAVETDAAIAKTVEVRALPDWTADTAATLAADAARAGAQVLVVRNTVDRARETWDVARAAAPDLMFAVNGHPTLHHSRFAAEDRALLDAQVERDFGKTRDIGGMILIGTQTLEQSLDIDADLLITDLCPMDVLLQRIGRLQRHARVRPHGFDTARATVLCPPGDLGALIERQENGIGPIETNGRLSGVYQDVPAVAATLGQIEARPVWTIPAMNRALVEAATHPDRLEALAEARGWGTYRQRLEGKTLAELAEARHVSLDRAQPIPERYPEDKIFTRLGEIGPVLTLPDTTVGPFGTPIRRLPLPPWWAHGLTGDEAVMVTPGDPMRLEVAELAFAYGAGGLTRA